MYITEPIAADFFSEKSSSGVVELCCVALYIWTVSQSLFIMYIYIKSNTCTCTVLGLDDPSIPL